MDLNVLEFLNRKEIPSIGVAKLNILLTMSMDYELKAKTFQARCTIIESRSRNQP